MARGLARLGVRRGDRVAMLLHNCAGATVLVHALLRLEATLVPLNVRLSDDELAWQIRDSAAHMVVVGDRTRARLDRFRTTQPALVVVGVDDITAPDLRDEPGTSLSLVHDPASVLAIIYTSGTTGRPKGAMLTVGNFWWSAIGSALNLGVHADDRWLVCMPLFHVGGLSILLRSAIYGIAAVVHDGFGADAVNRALDDERVTIVSVVTVMLQRMLDAHDDRSYPPSLRCVLLGGGPAPQPLLERCARLGIPVSQTYGLTETTSQIATLAPGDALRKIGAAGRAIYPNELRVVSDGRDSGTDEPGEIVVRGPVVMAGYNGRSDATTRAIVDGWLHTGDIGSLDSEGYLRVLDRRDDLIITGGENVYPAEVEAVLLAHPWVSEAGVVGVPDATWGQRILGLVRLNTTSDVEPTLAAEELRNHCRTQLAGYKTPSEILVVVDALARTASGKLRRNELREYARSLMSR